MSSDLWFPRRQVPLLASDKSWDDAEDSGVPSAGTVSSCGLHEEWYPCDERGTEGKNREAWPIRTL